MLYYFFNLSFGDEVGQNKKGEAMYSFFELGYYSTISKAKARISFYKNLPGFKDHPLDFFKIKKYGVKFKTTVEDKSKVDLFVLGHHYWDEDFFDYVVIFPPYATEIEAKEKMEKIKDKFPFCDYPEELTIVKHEVDRHVGWEEGFFYADLED